jgi:RimJ/RimL family protein N-acetyltransferase
VPELRLPDEPLSDGRVVLRPWVYRDVADAHAGMQDPEVPRFTTIPRGNPRTAVHLYLDHQSLARAAGTELALAVTETGEDRFLGSISLVRLDWDARETEIGYWLAPWGRGRGVMTAAVRLLAAWTFATLPLDLLHLRIDVDNAPSMAVAERCGFVRTGTALAADAAPGDRQRVDLALYALARGATPRR